MSYISLSQAFAHWQELAADLPKNDGPMLAESWNNYTDMLCKDGQLCDLQYQYAPAYDESMPGNGSRWDALSDDREFILSAMGVTMTATFVPFSQSRNKAEKNPSLNWRVTIKLRDRVVIADVDYMQGCAHCPAYKLSAAVAGAQNSVTRMRLIREECNSGRVAIPGRLQKAGAALPAPSLADVMQSLLLDGNVIDAGSFEDWCNEYGYDADSIKARGMYDDCLQIALKLRGAFGDKTMRELNELFEGM